MFNKNVIKLGDNIEYIKEAIDNIEYIKEAIDTIVVLYIK